MPPTTPAPTLLQILFGDSAPAALSLASARLLLWSDAFDLWLDERRRSYSAEACYISLLTWRRFLQECRKMPWDIAQPDVEAHVTWMLDRDYAASKINDVIGLIANFYRWCGERRIDPHCSADFNPAASVTRLRVRRYARTVLLSRREIAALLGYLRSDGTPLGRRDYALILARLRLGVSLNRLLALRWGQIVRHPDGDSIRWSAGISSPLPADVWDALHASLETAGRLPSMQPESFIFAPLADPLKEGEHDLPGVWAECVPMSREAVRHNLTRYGRRLDPPDVKLTLRAPHRTATRLRLDEGYTMQEMKAFLGSADEPSRIGVRLRGLPPLPPETDSSDDPPGSDQPPLPNRRLRRYRSEDLRAHGLAAASQPPEAVAALLAEDIQGIDEELAGLRSLARSLLDPPLTFRKTAASADWAEAYTQAASRLAIMIKAEAELDEQGKDREADEWARRYLKMMDRLAERAGEPPVSPAILAKVYGSESRLELTDRHLTEEIAATRYILRSTFTFASSELKPAAYLRLVDVYGQGCIRLVRLLKAGLGSRDRLVAYLKDDRDRFLEAWAYKPGDESDDESESDEPEFEPISFGPPYPAPKGEYSP